MEIMLESKEVTYISIGYKIATWWKSACFYIHNYTTVDTESPYLRFFKENIFEKSNLGSIEKVYIIAEQIVEQNLVVGSIDSQVFDRLFNVV